MKKRFWSLIFLTVLLCDGILLLMNLGSYRIVTKPLLIIILMLMVLNSTQPGLPPLKAWLLAALGCSAVGEALSFFADQSRNHLMAAGGAYLLAHLCYGFCLNQLRMLKHIRFRVVALVPALTYYVCLIGLLWDNLGDMKIPVIIFGAAVSFMLAMALILARLKNRRTAAFVFGGTLLFITADSLLVLDRYYHPLAGAGVWLTAILGLAQLYLSLGVMNHIGPQAMPRKSAEAMRQELLN